MNVKKAQIIPIFSGRTHKESENISDCQDFFAVNRTSFAVADGASQSFYPSIWAEMLVNNFCQNPNIGQQTWQQWLVPIQNQWLIEVRDRVQKAKLENKPIWITNQNRLNFRESATSTFIGLQLIDNRIAISIVGDSCLFVLKNTHFATSYPIQNSREFSDRPQYFASYAKDNAFTPDFFDMPLDFAGDLHFILATDALSEYIFKSFEQGKDIFRILLSISSQAEFEDFVAEARGAMDLKMKNDDVTLVILKVPNHGGLNDDSFPPFVPNFQKYKDIKDSQSLSKPNGERENISKIDLESDRLTIKKLTSENKALKRQRFILGSLLILTIFLFFYTIKSLDKTDETKSTDFIKNDFIKKITSYIVIPQSKP